MTIQITIGDLNHQRIKVIDEKGENLTYEWFKNMKGELRKTKYYINGSENLSVLSMYFIEALVILVFLIFFKIVGLASI